MFDDVIVVYKFYGDLMFFVTGSQEENELIIFAVLQAFYESISLLLRCRAPARFPARHSNEKHSHPTHAMPCPAVTLRVQDQTVKC